MGKRTPKRSQPSLHLPAADLPPGLSLAGPNPWQTLETRVAWGNSRLRVRDDLVHGPDGSSTTYTFVEIGRPVVVMVPLDASDHVYLVRQWRYPWGRNSWEVPAGHCELGEEPLAGARREMAEEIGLEAREWTALGDGLKVSALLSASYHLYLARDLQPLETGPVRDGSEQDMRIARVPLSSALDAAMDGTIVHVLTVAALLRVARMLHL